ncbi:hypothetical protein ABVE12_20815, partial [Xanthomonas euvesicatoria]
MGINEFNDGVRFSNRRNVRDLDSMEHNRNEWMAEAQRLRGELEAMRRGLEAVTADRDTWKAHGMASIELVRDLRESLAQSSPTNPFADRTKLNERLKARKVELVEQMGYRVL